MYEHLKRAIDFSVKHMGAHGMPAGLYADWNDCLRLGKDGESTFVAFQFYLALSILKEFAREKNDPAYLPYLEEQQRKLERSIQSLCWNEDRFIRGFKEDGETIGCRTDPEASMWLNPQSWAVDQRPGHRGAGRPGSGAGIPAPEHGLRRHGDDAAVSGPRL